MPVAPRVFDRSGEGGAGAVASSGCSEDTSSDFGSDALKMAEIQN